ncbi:MAG TPA: DinB family protein [Mucilaginibacter sp.]|jgi:uncharacterized damage-inducible protein DinB|nr:DinB family protein [Mucilaginibacter sp.]
MTKSEQIKQNLERALWGKPWYGQPIYTIIDQVSFEAAYEKPTASVHNIAGIVLHMLAWTEEVLDRMNGMAASIPSSGDWPDAGKPDEQKWQNYVNDLKLVNVNLLGAIQNFPEEKWDELINDTRENEPVTTYENLIVGFIEHQIYHAGQIALLTRITQIGG